MGLKLEGKQETGVSGAGKNALRIFRLTNELGQGEIEVTPRMKDLELMGLVPAAITRVIRLRKE